MAPKGYTVTITYEAHDTETTEVYLRGHFKHEKVQPPAHAHSDKGALAIYLEAETRLLCLYHLRATMRTNEESAALIGKDFSVKSKLFGFRVNE